MRRGKRRSRRRLPTILGLIAALLVLQLGVAPPAVAGELNGVYHDPYGYDELYGAQPTERTPRDPQAGRDVEINATTWPVSPGQSVWITWTKNGADQTPVGASWDHNSGNNSYWKLNLGAFARGDRITYTVHADVDGTNQHSIGPFSFSVTSWSGTADVTGYVDNGNSIDIATGDTAGDFAPKIRYAFPQPDQFHVQIAPNGNGLDISGAAPYTITDGAAELRIATSEIELRIQKSPYRVAVYSSDGSLIARQYDPATFRNVGWASDGNGTVTKIEDHWYTPPGERFEGFGERYDYLDQRGRDVHNYVYNQYRNQGSTHRTYLSVPFFTNSAGYGISIPSNRYSVFNLGTHLSDMAGFTVDTGGGLNSTADYYFYTGSRKEILNDYTARTGRPKLPPKWAFGLWMSANEWNTQDEVEAELANVRDYDIPHTAMVLEQWSDEATFYIWNGARYTPTPGSGSLSYSDLSFPAGTAWRDPKAMVDAAHNQDIKMLLWQIPVLKQNFDTNPPAAPQQHINDRDYAISQGYVLGDGDGGAYRIPSGRWFGDSTVPDFTSRAATDWWLSKRAYLLDEVGIDGFKTDGSESVFGRDVTAADGREGDELHNAYPNEYTGAYDDYVSGRTAGSGTIFSRAGTTGAQRNSIFWAGDQQSTFTAFREAVRAGISAGQSGIPFWAWDMAGFTGSFPTSELYLRAAAQATFSPIMQYHSEKADPSPSQARTPWNVQARTGDTSVIPTFRKYANIRMNLIPYLYTEAKHSSTTGHPMMRAMSFAFPGDATAAGQEQQYMFGRQLLVAPITTEGATSKDVYLPSGEWYDFFNGGRAQGAGTKTYYAGTDSIPVYARAGAIIPLNLNAEYQLGGAIGNSVTDYTNLTFRIYPSGTSSYDYFEDSAGVLREITSTADWANHSVTVDAAALTTKSTLQVASSKPDSVTNDGVALTEVAGAAELNAAPQGWYWDPEQQLTMVKLPPDTTARTVVLNGVDKAAYEAEFGTRTGTATDTDHGGYTGPGFVDQFDATGDSVSFDVHADSGGTHELRFRYANALSEARRTVSVDGVAVATLSLPALANWDTWGTATLSTSLGAGRHTIRLSYGGADHGPINLDNVTVARP